MSPRVTPIPSASEFAPASDDRSAAIESVVERFGRLLRHAAMRHGMGTAELDETVQEVRIRLWRSLGTGEKILQAPASYVYRAATTAALDLLRRQRARRAESLEVVAANAVPPAREVADADIRQSELARALDAALATLVESRRAVVRMHLAGYPRGEIAALLGWSEAKTRNLLYRGLEDLRNALLDAGMDPDGTPTMNGERKHEPVRGAREEEG